MTQTTPPGKLILLLILTAFLSIYFFSGPVFAGASIQQVKFFNDEQKTRVIFESNMPVVYSAYTTPEKPDLVLIDFPDTQLGDVGNVINVLSPELNTIQFKNINLEGDAFITRAELQLTSKLLYNISQQSNFLYIDILKPSNAAVPGTTYPSSADEKNALSTELVPNIKDDDKAQKSDPKEAAGTLPDSASIKQKPDNLPKFSLPYQLKEINYDINGNNLTVNLLYDGDPEYSTFELQKPDRLIIDFHSTVNRAYPRQVTLNTNNVLKIRTAQFQTEPVAITRVVFDITQPLTYKIFKSPGVLKVGFGSAAYLQELEASLKPVENDNTGNSKTAEDLPNVTVENAPIESDKAYETVEIQDESAPLIGNASIDVTTPVKNEDPGKTDVSLFETANPVTSSSALLSGQETAPPPSAGKTEMQKLLTDEDYAGKLVTEGKKYVGEPIGLKFKEADIRDVIQILGDITGKNFIVDPRVKGKVTINFTAVPWDQALDVILSMNNLGMVEENNVIIVASMQQLEEKAKKEKSLQEERELAGPVDVFTRRISYAKADEVSNIVKSYISRRGQVIVDKRTNLLLIRELRTRMQNILDLIDQLDIPTRQVHIEARIIETTRSYEKDLGIQWGWQAIANDEHGNATRYVFPHDITVQGGTIDSGISGVPYAVNLPPASPTSGIALSMGNVLNSIRLDAALQAMEETGKGKILATPSVSTQNNIEATISSGAKIPYTSIVDNTATVTFIQAKLELKVTPQITSDNTIIMKVQVEKTEPDYSRLITNVQGALPVILEKKAETTMLVKDGGTAVIGGILQVNDSEAERRTPFFHKIPLLGWLFKANNWKRTDYEMLIFLTPQILGYN